MLQIKEEDTANALEQDTIVYFVARHNLNSLIAYISRQLNMMSLQFTRNVLSTGTYLFCHSNEV